MLVQGKRLFIARIFHCIDVETAGASRRTHLPVSLERLPLGCQQFFPNLFLLLVFCFLHKLFSWSDRCHVLLYLEKDARSKA